MHLFTTGDVLRRGGGYFGLLDENHHLRTSDREERCSICGHGETHPLHSVVHCYHHDELEPLGEDPYVVCVECLHVYRTETELIELYNTMAQPFWLVPVEHGDEITFCQFCMHDF